MMVGANDISEQSYSHHGGAVLADESCGSVSFCGAFGELLSFNLDHDPEFTMSGLEEPCGSFEDW